MIELNASPNTGAPVLLATAGSGGTIAAARHLGRNGFNVNIVSSSYFAAAAWSQFVADKYSAPAESDGQRFLERLLDIGERNPGQVLLPTSDKTAWLYASNKVALERFFRIAQPSPLVLHQILDKKLFGDAAVRAGLTILPCWDPQTFEEVAALAPSLPYPILIKPRTHVHRQRNDKGIVVRSAIELKNEYFRYLDRERSAVGNDAVRKANLPFLQKFVDVGREGVYSVTGFLDRTGELFVTRDATKVFQRSYPVGVGVCFESRPRMQALSDAVYRLCRELKYFGIFEVEFLRFDGQWVVIDFNPRLFSQVGMDIFRGMPLPLFAYLEATGDFARLREAVEKARDGYDSQVVFYDRFTLRAILFAQMMTGRSSKKTRLHWRDWMRRHAPHAVDFSADEKDPRPELLHVLSEIYLGIKSFPRFLRLTPRAPSRTPLSFRKNPS